ncbi:MAG TPA: sigma-70 family RNA polymerase sigma factor [Phycisphaerae bacterium]|nr:sigma-70 family RNA polymerase sigma factor [Phycisphaerae bacterium]
MAPQHRSTRRSGESEPDDAALLARLAGGDESALTVLMRRYDRLVRYTIWRASQTQCAHDPAWLDSLASETWTGLVHAARSAVRQPLRSIPVYLARIAYNRCISALRSSGKTSEGFGEEFSLAEQQAVVYDSPEGWLSRVEELSALRDCIRDLSQDEQMICAQLAAIVERRWGEAAAALGMPESTLRSRWERITQRLARCVQRKTGVDLAPPG